MEEVYKGYIVKGSSKLDRNAKKKKIDMGDCAGFKYAEPNQAKVIDLLQDFVMEHPEESNLLALSEKLQAFFSEKLYVYPKEDFIDWQGDDIDVLSEAQLAIKLLAANYSEIASIWRTEFNETLADIGGYPEPEGMLDAQKFEWLQQNFGNITLEQLEALTEK